MKDFAKVIIDLLGMENIDYGDVRVEEYTYEAITIKNGIVENVATITASGFGVRVLKNGAWGFAASSEISALQAEQIIKKAVELANASGIRNPGIELGNEKIPSGEYFSNVKESPFDVSLTEKIDHLLEVDKILSSSKYVFFRVGSMTFFRAKKYFASTEGAFQHQEITHSGSYLHVKGTKDGDVQSRTFDNTLQGGYEIIREFNLKKRAESLVEDVEKLLFAPPAPEGEMDVIIGPHQMVLQIHESIGHAVELDRIFGYELGYAGGSFITPDMIGNFRYGAPLMNIYQDATNKRSIGGFGFDDEGVPAKKEYIVKNGVLVGVLSSRETARRIGRESSGAARAEAYDNIPIVRMTTVSIEPGEHTLEEMIESVKDGLMIDWNKSWSIDDKRLNFQFGTEMGWRIKNGKIVEVVKNPIYYDITTEFWHKLDMVGNKDYKVLFGVPNCGKGEPGQTMRVAHETVPVLFRKVKVGSSR